MWQKSMANGRRIPFCADPENHVLVEAKERLFWRKKRTKVTLNKSFEENADLSKISGPAAQQVVQRLRPFFNGLSTGRITLRVGNNLRKGLKEKKTLGLARLNGIEFQRDYPLGELLTSPYTVEAEGREVKIKFEVSGSCVKKQNALATHFYFEAVLLHGDPNLDNSLRVESTISRLFSFSMEGNENCQLSLELPGEGVQWMVVLKVSCLEGEQLAAHPKHYAMKVVGTGR